MGFGSLGLNNLLQRKPWKLFWEYCSTKYIHTLIFQSVWLHNSIYWYRHGFTGRLENNVDPDQLASFETSWSGSVLFSKECSLGQGFKRKLFWTYSIEAMKYEQKCGKIRRVILHVMLAFLCIFLPLIYSSVHTQFTQEISCHKHYCICIWYIENLTFMGAFVLLNLLKDLRRDSPVEIKALTFLTTVNQLNFSLAIVL